jgi:hypothetical protein
MVTRLEDDGSAATCQGQRRTIAPINRTESAGITHAWATPIVNTSVLRAKERVSVLPNFSIDWLIHACMSTPIPVYADSSLQIPVRHFIPSHMTWLVELSGVV